MSLAKTFMIATTLSVLTLPSVTASAATEAAATAKGAVAGPATPASGSPDVVPVIAVDPHRSSTPAPRVVVRGAATPGAVLAIDGHRVGVVDASGRWRVRLRLHDGVNNVTFGAADQAGYATATYTIRHTRPFTVTKASLPDGATQVRIRCRLLKKPCKVTLQLIGYGDKAHAKTERPLKQKVISIAPKQTRTLRLINSGGKVYVLALRGNPATPHTTTMTGHAMSAADAKKKKKKIEPKRGTPAVLNVVATSDLSTTSTTSSSGGDDDTTTGQATAPPSSTPPPSSPDPSGAAILQSAPVTISGMITLTDVPTTPAPAIVVPVDPNAPVSVENSTTILGYYVDTDTNSVYESDDVMTTYTYGDGAVIVQDKTISVPAGTYPPGTDPPIIADFTPVTVPVSVTPPPVNSCAYNIGGYVGANSLLGPGPCT